MNEFAEYELRLKDLFSGKLDRIEQRLNQFENRVNQTGNITGGVFGGIALERAAEKAIEFISNVGSSIVSLGTTMEKTRVTFKTLLGGDADFSNSMIAKFQKFAQETPFNTNDVLQGAKKLTAAKVAMQEIIPVMSKLGDISSGTGNPFEYLTFLYQHTKGMGHLTGRLSNEFQLAGIDIASQIEKKMGISGDQYHKMISAKMITFKDVDAALTAMTSKGGQFYHLNDQLSKTVFGRWERFKDTLEIIGTRLGEQLLPMLSSWLDKAFDAVNRFQNLDMSGTIANFEALERVADKLAEIFGSASWGDFAETLSYGFRRTLAEVERLINRVQYMNDIAVQIKENGLVTGSRMYSLRQQQLDKEFMSSFDEFNQRENDIQKSRGKYTSSEAKRKLEGYNNLYDNTHKGFNYVYAGKQGGGEGEGEGEGIGGGIEKISAGSRNITVNITKLIETVNFTKSYEQEESKLKEMITRALVSEVNNVNIVAQ